MQAISELQTCTRRRGEALALFNFTVSAHRLPPSIYWRARAEEGLGMPSAAASYREYLALRGGADHDSLATDARRRLPTLSDAGLGAAYPDAAK